MKSVLALAALSILTLSQPACAATNARSVTVDAPSGAYVSDITHASILWKVSHMGLSYYPARFTAFDARLDFDAAKPENSKLKVSVDAKSIRTEFPFREKEDFDAALSNGADWFDAGKYPEITFVSKSIKRTGPKTADITGDLTLKGVTRPITLKAVFNGSMKSHPFYKIPYVGFSATGAIKRSDFGLNKLIPIVGDEVTLQIEAEFKAAQ